MAADTNSNNPLHYEAMDVIQAGVYKKLGVELSFTLHAKEDFIISNPIDQTINRDFISKNGDEVTVKFSIPLGDFIYAVLPNKENLEITVIETTVGAQEQKKYKFSLGELPKEITEGKYSDKNITELNKDIVMLSGQCINPTMLKLKTRTVEGIYQDTTIGKVINAMLMDGMGKINMLGGLINNGVNMASPDNTRTYKQIIVQETNILALPEKLQTGKEYGVYNGGISLYMKTHGEKEEVFVFAPYRVTTSNKTKSQLRILITPSIQSAMMDNTYAIDGDLIKIIGIIKQGKDELAEDKKTDKGSGFTMTDSNTLGKRSHQVHPDKITIDTENVKRAHVSGDKKDGNQTVINAGVTGNIHAPATEVLKAAGANILIEWKISNARFLIPGMYAELLMVNAKNELTAYVGMLHGVQIFRDAVTKSETSMLNVFVNNTDLVKTL